MIPKCQFRWTQCYYSYLWPQFPTLSSLFQPYQMQSDFPTGCIPFTLAPKAVSYYSSQLLLTVWSSGLALRKSSAAVSSSWPTGLRVILFYIQPLKDCSLIFSHTLTYFHNPSQIFLPFPFTVLSKKKKKSVCEEPGTEIKEACLFACGFISPSSVKYAIVSVSLKSSSGSKSPVFY